MIAGSQSEVPPFSDAKTFRSDHLAQLCLFHPSASHRPLAAPPNSFLVFMFHY